MTAHKEIDELEFLAEQFIIGYKPLTEKQKEILENIRAMELQLQITKTKAIRIQKVINTLYHNLAWSKST